MSTSFSGSVKLSDCGSASEQEKCDIGVSVEEFNVERSNGRSKLSVKLPQALQYVGSLDYGNPDNDTSCCAIKMEMDGGASLDKLPQENPKEGTCSVETQGQYQLEQTKEDGSCYDWEKLISDAAPDVLIFNSSTESVTCTEEDNNMVDFDATSFALVSHPPQDEVDGLHNAQPVSSLHQQQQQQQQQQNPINQLEEVEDGEQKETDHTPQLLPSVYQNEQDTGDLCEKMDEKVGDCISLGKKARLGGEDIGYSFRRDLKLISEVQAPFRGVRRFFYVAFSAAAGISTFFTIPRLIDAVKGGDDAPDIWETSGNAAINIGGIIVLVALFFWDNKKEEEQLAQISRDETLSRLPLRLSTNRIVELVQLQDTSRPIEMGDEEKIRTSNIFGLIWIMRINLRMLYFIVEIACRLSVIHIEDHISIIVSMLY